MWVLGLKGLMFTSMTEGISLNFSPRVSNQESNAGFTVTLYVISPLHWGTLANTLRSGQDRRTAYT